MAAKHVTVLSCPNGWSAVYDSTGKRVSEIESLEIAELLANLGIDVELRSVPNDASYPDFPKSV